MHNCTSCNRLLVEEVSECPFCSADQEKRFKIPRSVKMLGASATAFVMAACYGIGPMDYKETGEDTGVALDLDDDGFPADVDCDDSNAAINPEATEDCTDGVDNDCDGTLDGDDEDCQSEGATQTSAAK